MKKRLQDALNRLKKDLASKTRSKNANLYVNGFKATDLLRVVNDPKITVDFGGRTSDPGHTFAETFTGEGAKGQLSSATQVYEDAQKLTDSQLEGVLCHEASHVLLNEKRLKMRKLFKDNASFKAALKALRLNTMHPSEIFNSIDNAFPTGIRFPDPPMPIFTP